MSRIGPDRAIRHSHYRVQDGSLGGAAIRVDRIARCGPSCPAYRPPGRTAGDVAAGCWHRRALSGASSLLSVPRVR